MFERITESFQGLYRKLSGQSTLSESNIADAMQDVRTALLEADVALPVVEDFCARVQKEAVGREVTKRLSPAHEMIGIVHEELVKLLGGTVDAEAGGAADVAGPTVALGDTSISLGGGEPEPIMRVSPGPTIVMMCGLQGSGKTTTCGKLAAYLKKRGRSVMLAAADLQRPAAVDQLQTVAEQVNHDLPGGAQVHFYAEPDKVAAYGKAVGVAVDVCRRALDAARAKGVDTLILDTAGRLHVNDALMGELRGIDQALSPHHVLLVVDAMTGQDAVVSAKAFHGALSVDGVILTKFDSDTRGGAAISIKAVTGAPIKFIGVGEKLEAIEEFHPKRMAGRILGMGDVVSLVEKAQEQVSEEEAAKLNEKMAKGQLSMEDFLKQLKMLRRMGPLKSILGMLPGVGSALKDFNVEDKQLDRVEAIIHSMTRKERERPDVIDLSRRRRIAKGSGTNAEEVGTLVKQFQMMSQFTRRMAGLGTKDRAMAAEGMRTGDPAAMAGLMRRGSGTASKSIKDRFKKRKR